MKKTIYSAMLLIGTMTAGYAQPVPAANMPPVNEKFSMYSSTTAVTHGASGANQTWDYSAAAKSLLYEYTWVSYSGLSQEIRDTFPDGTHANELRIGPMAANTDVYKVTAGALISLGAKGSGSAWNIHYAPRTMFTIPMALGDTFGYQVSAGTHQTCTYDAWGTLKTPFGTFSNVARMRIANDGVTDAMYMFYQFSPTFKKLAHYVLNSGSTTQNVFFYSFTASPSGVDQVQDAATVVYPNPVTSGTAIQVDGIPAGVQQLQLVDLMGRCVATADAANASIATTGIQPGVYFIRMSGEAGVQVQRVVVK